MLKNRIELARYFAELGFKKGVVIGTCTGRYARILLQEIPDLQLLTVDSYIAYREGGAGRSDETNWRNYQKARRLLAPWPNAVLAVGFAHDVVQWVADDSLDFVFIDGGHSYDMALQDINDWTPKVRHGGIVSGHDYYETKRMRVKEAVD